MDCVVSASCTWYAKLSDNMIRPAPDRVKYNGTIVFNPSAEVLEELGYLPVEYSDPPQDAPEGKHYAAGWEQTDAAIIQVWTLADDYAPPEPEPTTGDLQEQLNVMGDAVQELILMIMG